MLRKLFAYILIILGLAILVCSTNRDIMQQISEKRNDAETWWGAHQSNNGDLVNMAYLDYAEKFHTKLDYKFSQHPAFSNTGVALYAWGDSYIWKIPDTAYAVDEYHFGWRYRDNLEYNIVSSKKNILLIEIAERYVRIYFQDKTMLNNVHKSQQQVSLTVPLGTNRFAAFGGDVEMEDIFNPNINQNLEYNLFNYNFINPVRQLKASMNYQLFARASGNVAIADNREYLFLKETIAAKVPESSYSHLSEEEVNHIVNILNELYDIYRNDGFDEVYLSMIPNPATIIQPEGYNMLIPRIQNHPQLKMKVLDVYSRYQKTDEIIYRRGDTHWNNNGLQIWLKMVNDKMLSYAGPSSHGIPEVSSAQ